MLTLRELVYLEAEVTEEIKKLGQVCSILQGKGFFDRATAERKLVDEVILRGVAGMLQDYYSKVISAATYEKLDELRSFRHRVGNIYGFNLIPERVVNHLLSLPELNNSFKKDICSFFETMKSTLKNRLKNAGKPERTP